MAAQTPNPALYPCDIVIVKGGGRGVIYNIIPDCEWPYQIVFPDGHLTVAKFDELQLVKPAIEQ